MKRLLALCLLLFAGSALAGPRIQHWTLPSGLSVYFLEAHELPMVDLKLVFDAGSARDGDLPGLASMTAGELFSGTRSLDLETLSDRLDRVGADYGAGALRDMAWITLRSLTDADTLQPALDTWLQVVGEPAFPAEHFERARRQRLVALRAEREDPGTVASKAFWKAVYGDHPYAHPVNGTEQSTRALKREDLIHFHRRYYVSGNAILVIVGDRTRAQAEALARRVDGVLPRGPHAPPLPPVPELRQARTVRIPFPSTQAHILVGQPGMKRGDADYFPLYLGNHVLGGSGFTSRLVKTIRVEHGLAYSVYSYFLPMRAAGPFMAGLQTRRDQTGEALALLRKTLEDYVEQGPTEAELRASKRNVTGGFPLRIASNGDLADYLAMIGFYGLPLDYLDRFNERIEAVTAAQIRDAFRRRIHPERMVTVIVGGPEAAP